MLSAIMRGGESVGSTAAKGLSDARRGFRVVMMTSTGPWREAAASRAVDMSDLDKGLPAIVMRFVERFGWLVMDGWLASRVSGLRARAVILWLRFRDSFRTWIPVRPVAPRRRICIFVGGWGGGFGVMAGWL